MKKIVCGILCASTCAAVASIEQVVSTIEVRAVNSGLTNTVVAVPGIDLASDGAVAISNLVKTTNLAEGDRLVAFTNDKYESWVLNASKVWVKNSKLITIDGSGAVSEGEGTASDLMTLGVGSGIWLSRVASGTSAPFYVYARQPSTTNSTVAAGSAALVGNPTIQNKSPTITGMANKDQIMIPKDKFPEIYTYSDGKWKWIDSSDKIQESATPPSITAGTGFWYVSKGGSNVTINWAD